MSCMVLVEICYFFKLGSAPCSAELYKKVANTKSSERLKCLNATFLKEIQNETNYFMLLEKINTFPHQERKAVMSLRVPNMSQGSFGALPYLKLKSPSQSCLQ